jgi:hypothetical protein
VTTTAVEMRCPRGHLIATVHPFPALGSATHIEVKPRPARYHASLADYVSNASESTGGGWVTTPARAAIRVTVDEFSSPSSSWSRSVVWACRCGTNRLNMQDLITAAWAWSAERRQKHGNPPKPRVVTLESTSVP